MDNIKTNKEYARYLSPLDVLAIAFGCIVGWGAFVMPGTDFLPLSGVLGTVIAMILGMALMLIIGYNYSYLMKKKQGIGGVYTYTKHAFGREHAFICSWFLCLSYVTICFLNATAVFVVAKNLFGDAIKSGISYQIAGHDVDLHEVLLSVGILVIIGTLLIFKKPLMQYVNTILAILLFVGVVILFIAALPKMSVASVFSFSGKGNNITPVMGIMTITLLAPWAFVGFDVASLETAHFKFKMSKSKWIIFISIIIGAFVYIAMTLVASAIVPEGYGSLNEYIADLGNVNGVMAIPTFYVANKTLGIVGLVIIGIAAFSAILTGIIGACRASVRILSIMAEDNILSSKFKGTTFCILFLMIIAIITSFLGRNTLAWYVDLTSFGAIIGFGYTSASAIKIAKEDNNKKVVVTGIIGLVISIVFATIQLLSRFGNVSTMSSHAFLLLAIWCLIGFIFYWRTMKNGESIHQKGKSIPTAVLFGLLLYSSLMWFINSTTSAIGQDDFRSIVVRNAVVLVLVVISGLAVMLYIQELLRKQSEANEREKIRAEETSKAKSQFLFNMSHDIRTPMNAILGYTHIAKEVKDVPPEVANYLEKIDVSGKHLLNLINDILEMSRIENGKLELYVETNDICEVMNTAFDMFEGQMKEKNIHYNLEMNDISNKWVLLDRTRILRIILNLIGNAYKFTPEGGSIDVKLKQITSDTNDYGKYVIVVKDTGIGMSEEFSKNVFEAFAREKTSTVSKIQGTGLGLAITKNIVDVMGGTIELETKQNVGTTFTITVPLKIDNEKEKEVIVNEVDDSFLVGKRVLLVEDIEINREIAMMFLADLGLEVECAENGSQAVELVEKSGEGYYDVVLMDIQMPIMDGYEATKHIRNLQGKVSEVPIIALTANAFKEDIMKAKEAGMDGHISKPIEEKELIDTLKTILYKKEDK